MLPNYPTSQTWSDAAATGPQPGSAESREDRDFWEVDVPHWFEVAAEIPKREAEAARCERAREGGVPRFPLTGELVGGFAGALQSGSGRLDLLPGRARLQGHCLGADRARCWCRRDGRPSQRI